MDEKNVPGKVCYLPTGVNMQHVGDGTVYIIDDISKYMINGHRLTPGDMLDVGAVLIDGSGWVYRDLGAPWEDDSNGWIDEEIVI
jgi:hypothetical protein